MTDPTCIRMYTTCCIIKTNREYNKNLTEEPQSHFYTSQRPSYEIINQNNIYIILLASMAQKYLSPSITKCIGLFYY